MQRGDRQTAKSRAALKQAFRLLLKQKGYGEITVGEIADSADTGRSTFYRHFQSKADVLIALHEDIFTGLFLDESSPMEWLAETPPLPLKRLISGIYETGGPMVSLSADIGADADYIMRESVGIIAAVVEKGLEKQFANNKYSIPLPVLSSSIAGIYGMVLMSWKTTFRDVNDGQLAEYIHRLTRAAIKEALA